MEDNVVRGWVLEFILGCRKPVVESNLIMRLIPLVPSSDFDSSSSLRKRILVRAIQDIYYTVPEGLLRMLEVLEELHRHDGAPITAAMKDAYCAVAVDCTLKYLPVENPAYLGAVNRIWHNRVGLMNSGKGSLLPSPELERWKTDIEASLSDLQVRERLALASVDTRRDAVTKLTAFLVEEWTNLGPSFLELAASQHINISALATNHHQKVCPTDADVPCPHNNERGGTSNHDKVLKGNKPTNITKNNQRKRWSQLEEETLKTAIDEFGHGNWKLILETHKHIFKDRTQVNLKDKFRSMKLR